MGSAMKRGFSLFLCLLMLFAALPASTVLAEDLQIDEIDDEDLIVILDEDEFPTFDEIDETEPEEYIPDASTPEITTQPKSKTACEGYAVSFSVTASNATSYQWYYRSSSSSEWVVCPEASAKSAKLSYSAVYMGVNGFQYRCKVSNSAGYIYSNIVTLTVTVAPAITTQPTSKTVSVGTTAKFSVTASGALSYQWYYRTSNSGAWTKSTMSSATSATISIPATTGRNGYQYRCLVANSKAYVYSNTVTLTVVNASLPTITTQPESVTATAGATVLFSVNATNASSYEWQYRTNSAGTWYVSTLTGAKTSKVSVPATTARNGYQYRCKVSNSNGYVFSNTVTLTVKSNSKPSITTQPESVTATAGATARFTVKASNATSYQWQYRESSSGSWYVSGLDGAKTATVYVPATMARNGFQYRCKVSNANGSVFTNIVTLTVKSNSKPTISVQPVSVTATVGATASFTVKASNATSYQWQYRKSSSDSWYVSACDGAKTSTVLVPATTARNGYQYRCKVSNANGYVFTNIVTLTVKSGAKPTITTQPTSVTKYQDNTAKFTVKASNATSYQWYYRTSSSASWQKSTLSSATSSTISVIATRARNGYQYRCKVSNANGYVYSNTVTLSVNLVSYRALLIGEVSFSWDKATRNRGDVTNMKNMLNSVKGARGGTYAVTCKYDQTYNGIVNSISTAFANADSNDVSLFFIATHGVVDVYSGPIAGQLCTVDSYGNEGRMNLEDLAACLKAVPGKVIVFIGACGSGAAIYGNGATPNDLAQVINGEDAFGEAVIQAFAAVDEPLEDLDDEATNTGEFRDSKFYVMTAAAHQEESWGYEYDRETMDGYNTFPLYISQGVMNGKPADSDGNGTVTLNELYNYVYPRCYDEGPFWSTFYNAYVYQHVQVYPENSSYGLFK